MRKRKKFDWSTFWLFVLLASLEDIFHRRGYKGDRSHLKGANAFVADLLCFLCLTSLALLFVRHIEKRDRVRAERAADRACPAASRQTSVTKRPEEKVASKAVLAPAAVVEGEGKARSPIHTMPTEAQRRQELAWQAQQAAAELEEQQAQKAAQVRQEAENQQRRQTLRKEAAEALQKLNQELPDDLGGEVLQVERRGEEGPQYCGRIYLSRLVDFDDPEQAFSVDVPGENIRYSISWGSIPSELRDILKEYCSAGGMIAARTQHDWINEAEYKLWVALYLIG